MEEQPVTALIVVRPGPLRNSLLALMNTMPQIEIVAESRDVSSLLRMGTQLQPDLVLLETELPGDGVQEALRQIRDEWSATHTIVLVDNAIQRLNAQKAGADVVLYKGFRAASLVRIISSLLPQNVSPNYLERANMN